MSANYRLFPLFAVRAAGAPYDEIEKVATPRSAALVRELLSFEEALDLAARHALDSLRGRSDLPPKGVEATRKAIGHRRPLPPRAARTPEVDAFADLQARFLELEQSLATTAEAESSQVNDALEAVAKTHIRRYLVLGSQAARDALGEEPDDDASARHARTRSQHLLMYLQRLCTKNETVSEFGPVGFGRVGEGAGFEMVPLPGIQRRDTFLEKWALQPLAEALAADADVRAEAAPRRHPLARFSADRFERLDTGGGRVLSRDEQGVLERCDGFTPAHALQADELLARLADDGAILWRVEPVPFHAHWLELLVADVRRFREGPARERWLPKLEGLASVVKRFGETEDVDARHALMDEARARLEAFGARPREGKRLLYAGTNPIGEECLRDYRMTVSEGAAEALCQGAAPWFDLWRDVYAFAGSRVATKMRELFATAPSQGGRVPLPVFMAHCAKQGFQASGQGLALIANGAYEKVRAAFIEEVRGRADASEWSLTPDELGFARRRFSFEPFDAYTWPSADLQLAAASPDAVARGDYRWVVAELHSGFTLTSHAITWACPDEAALAEELRRHAGGVPLCSFADQPLMASHATPRYFELLGDLWTFACPERGRPEWPTVRPADCDVRVEETTGDVCIHEAGTGRKLRSFSRSWSLAFGFHPFVPLSLPIHTPRLSVGGVVVQRETWILKRGELPGPLDAPASKRLVAAAKLREAKSLPRWVYVRPTTAALGRYGALRDKDIKPIFLDLESLPFVDVLFRWARKYDELEVSEMLPSPEELPWRERDGRRTFELRTLVGPR